MKLDSERKCGLVNIPRADQELVSLVCQELSVPKWTIGYREVSPGGDWNIWAQPINPKKRFTTEETMLYFVNQIRGMAAMYYRLRRDGKIK